MTVFATTRIPAAGRTQLEHIASDALQGLAPVVVVNRRSDTATAMIGANSDAPFPTIHDDTRTTPTALAQRTFRGAWERVRGIYGDGADAGHTIYGSVRFVGADDVAAGADAVVAALAKQGSVGVRAFGPVSLVAAPSAIADRTTYAGDDTGATLVRVRESEDLPKAIVDRLDRLQGSGAGPQVGELLQSTHQAAVDTVRSWLQSSALADSRGYIEGQVRGMSAKDLIAAVVDMRPLDDSQHRSMITPGDAPTADQIATLANSLARIGAPVHSIGNA